MRSSLLLLLIGCTPPAAEKCASGIAETFGGAVQTPTGEVVIEASQCLTVNWQRKVCNGRPESCDYLFPPDVAPEVPLNLIGSTFAGTHGYAHLEVATPEVLDGATDIEARLTQVQTDRLEAGYEVGPIQKTKLLGDVDAIGLIVSCDHPDVDEGCPYTWNWLFADLSSIEEGVYGDFSSYYAGYVQAANASAERPPDFAEFNTMIRTAVLLEE